MKKNRFVYVFATLIIGMALVFSCQKEEIANQDQVPGLKSASIDCSECVDNWTDSKVTETGWVKSNKPEEVAPNTYLDIYNDATHNNYRVYRTSGTFEEVRVNGMVAYSGVGVNTYSWQAPLSEGWKACDKVTATVELRGVSGGIGKTNVQSFDYYLRELCPPECEESFTYTDNGTNSYTFTYTPAEDMAEQLVVFTFAQGTVVVGLDETWSTNGSTRQKTMSFIKCEPVSWTVTLTPDCSGHSGKSNVWTDFKVNDDSKKGSNANIVIDCPDNK